MSNQDNLEISNQQPVIEDLAINQDETSDVKGGAETRSFYAFPGFIGGVNVSS